MFKMCARASVVVGACGLAASMASAQDSWFVDDVPDFDQRRSFGGGRDGLPGNGGMHCVPTSSLNWLAYFANGGIEQSETLDGPRDWEDDANYQRVTETLDLLGAFMGTDPMDGTNGAGQLAGLTVYNWAFCASDLTFAENSLWGGSGAPSPTRMLLNHLLGGYVETTYGRYGSPEGGTRDGGHAISAIGVWDLTSGVAPIFQFRDPADDGADTTQSEFRVSLAVMVPVTGLFRPKSSSLPTPLTLWRLDVTDETDNFLDSMTTFFPAAGVFASDQEANEIRIVRPVRPAGNPMPLTQFFSKAPGTGRILDTAFSQDMTAYYYTTAQSTAKPELWRLDAMTGVSSPAVTNPFSPTKIEMGRSYDAYVMEASSIVRYSLRTQPGSELASTNFPWPPAEMAYNDLNDTLLVLSHPPTSGDPRRVFTKSRTLAAGGTDRALPVDLDGEVFIQPDAVDEDAFWVAGRGGLLGLDAVVYKIRWDAMARRLVVVETITRPRSTITGLQVVNDQSIVLTVGGELLEMINDRGVWKNKPDSRWTGRQAEGTVTLSRSRTDFDPVVMTGPSFNNLVDPTIYPSHPDCYADCDGDGALTIFDFLCFQNKFEVRDLAADCDLDGRWTIFDFLCFQNRFSSGCE
jgi:hypothetical protein